MKYSALLSFIAIFCPVHNAFNFKRVRQEIEKDKHGMTHVFVHVLDYNSSFELLLNRSEFNVFAEDHTLSLGKEEHSFRPSFMYEGIVKNQPDSQVSGTVHDEAFEGTVYLPGTDKFYFIESGRRLFGSEFCSNDFRFCYIIHQLGSDDTHSHDHFKKRSATAEAEEGQHGLGMCGWHSPKVRDALLKLLDENAYPNKPIEVPESRRVKRQTQSSKPSETVARSSTPKYCDIFMQADPKLWDLFMSDYKNDEAKARTQLLRHFSQIIQGVNEIYKATVFQSNDGTAGPYQMMQFRIVRTAIYSSATICGDSNTSPTKEFCRDNIDSAEFLSLNSKLDHDKYCLAYLMTHRQFSEGVQGLAWVGYPKSYAGGVCQKRMIMGGKEVSYNTGIFTSNNYGKRSSVGSLILTVAHEIGHNFGSQHDKTECQPGGADGNFIMYPYVTPGDRKNNNKFSSCSKDSIAINLNAVINEITSNKRNCLKDDKAALCGNGIVEENEQCDCGFSDECKAAGDKYCNAADENNPCTLKQGATCSPSNGACCDPNTGNLLSAEQAAKTICRPASECSDASYCTSTSPACPVSSAKPDGSLCWENSRVCMKGECSLTLCSLIKTSSGVAYESCQETIPDGDTNFGKYCYLSCKSPNSDVCTNSVTVTSASIDGAFYAFLNSFGNDSTRGKPISLGSGSPCNNFKGFCDEFSRCRNVNSQGPLRSLFALLSGDQAPQTAAQWLVAYWWVVALVAVIFVALALVLTQLFARKCLPSSNPKKHARRSMKDSCRRTFCPCAKNNSVNAGRSNGNH